MINLFYCVSNFQKKLTKTVIATVLTHDEQLSRAQIFPLGFGLKTIVYKVLKEGLNQVSRIMIYTSSVNCPTCEVLSLEALWQDLEQPHSWTSAGNNILHWEEVNQEAQALLWQVSPLNCCSWNQTSSPSLSPALLLFQINYTLLLTFLKTEMYILKEI